MKRMTCLAVVMLAVVNAASADIIRGIDIDFVTIGNAGNAPDTQVMDDSTSGYGAVGYNYRISKYEITNAQWNSFTAAAGVPTGNPSNAYNQSAYFTGNQQPTDNVSWYEAAQFCNYLTTGRQEDSDPSGMRRDQRVFCLLKSPVYDSQWSVTLADGWHPAEAGHFRWTERRFSVRLERAGPCTATSLTFDFFLPEDHLRRLGPVTLAARLNARELPPQVFRDAGECRYRQPIPPGTFEGGVAVIEFTLDKAAPPGPEDQRELGLAVSFAREGCAVADSNLPLEIE